MPWAALSATLISALLYALAFPTIAIRPLAWIALAPLLIALRATTTRQAVLLAWVWTLVSAYGLNDWFPRAVSRYYEQPTAVGAGFFLGVSTLTAAPAFVAFTLWLRAVRLRPGMTMPLLIAAAWVAAELLRTKLLRDPWGLLGHSQAGVVAVTQIAELTGVYGVSFVIAAVNAAIAGLWETRASPDIGRSGARRGIAGAAALGLLVAGYGWARARSVGETALQRVVVIQGNLDLGAQWRWEFYGENLDTYLRMTLSALRDHPPALVIWPENALTFFLNEERIYRNYIGRVLRPSGAELVTGGPYQISDDPPSFHNSAFLLDATGDIRARYDKQLLLPFAEYFPLSALDFLQRRFAHVREFTPGDAAAQLLPTIAGSAGVVICNEALFPEPARERVEAGAALLLVLANDSWLNDPKFSGQAFEISSFRAIEQRRWLVRASTSGPSAIVDPAGRVIARSGTAMQDTVQGYVGARSGLTPYARVGDLFGWLCTAVALLAVARRNRPDD